MHEMNQPYRDGGTMKLDIRFTASDSQDHKSFFPVTMALWRGGYKVLYAGNEPGLKKQLGFMGMTNSFVVTERRKGWADAGKKECWLLPLTGEEYLKSFLAKTKFSVNAHGIRLWSVDRDPEDFPTIQFFGGVRLKSYPHGGSGNLEVLPLSKDTIAEGKDREINRLKASLELQKKAIQGFRCNTAEDKLMVKSLQDRISEFDKQLDAAETASRETFDDLQIERKKAFDLAGVIDTLKKKVAERDWALKSYKETNIWQASKIRKLSSQVDVKEKSKDVLHRANQMLVKRLEESRKGAKPQYEVEAYRDVSLSSFKMSTIATAVRWLCAASTAGALAYMLV